MSRILVVHASVGGGHTNAAIAIAEALEARGERDVSLIDYNDLVPKWQCLPVQAAYWWVLGRVPVVWRSYYRHTDRPEPTIASRVLATSGIERTMELLAKEEPELVISTFTGAGALIGGAREALGMEFAHVSVATDFVPHRHWVRDGIDRWCVPCDEGRMALMRNGAPASRVVVTGLPIRRAVRQAIANPPDLRARFGLDDRPVIVAAAGARPTPRAQIMLEQLARLETPAQILVCFAAPLPRSAHVRFVDVGLTQRFPDLLAGCDLLVGKAGGATTAEATAAGKPLVVIDPFPGQEEDNASWLVRHGGALWARDPHEIVPSIDAVLADRERFARAARRLARANAAEAAVSVAIGERDRRYSSAWSSLRPCSSLTRASNFQAP
jgi:processive 1,2-diacylglycerol beta-glucosyltransferase